MFFVSHNGHGCAKVVRILQHVPTQKRRSREGLRYSAALLLCCGRGSVPLKDSLQRVVSTHQLQHTINITTVTFWVQRSSRCRIVLYVEQIIAHGHPPLGPRRSKISSGTKFPERGSRIPEILHVWLQFYRRPFTLLIVLIIRIATRYQVPGTIFFHY